MKEMGCPPSIGARLGLMMALQKARLHLPDITEAFMMLLESFDFMPESLLESHSFSFNHLVELFLM